MFIDIEDKIRLGGDSRLQIQSPISGLEKAPIRINYNNLSGRDGGYISSQFYSPRQITIRGFYTAKNCDDAQNIRTSLASSLQIRRSLNLYITSFNGSLYTVECYVSDFKMDITNDTSGIYQITFVSPSPYIYGGGKNDTTNGYVMETISKTIGGGYVFPYVLPVAWKSGSQARRVTNDTLIDIFPDIILTGKFTNPVITNNTTGKFIKINSVTSSVDTIKISMSKREITLNGGSIASSKTADSSWWSLTPGINEILLKSDDTSDMTTAKLQWRKVYEGI